MVLGGQDRDTITNAFRRWMETSATMPTPADIIEICNSMNADKRRAQVFNDDIEAAKSREYIAPIKAVSWAYKPYSEFNPKDHENLKAHLSDLEETRGEQAARDYMLYLKNHNKINI